MTDIVIPLGSGSKNGDLELRYCLRSIQQNVKNVGDIYIIGTRPKFLQNVIIHEVPEFAGSQYRHHNICNKLLLAASLPELSEDFLFFNDDHFIVHDYEASTFPYYYDDTLQRKGVKLNTVSPYRKTINNTFDYLKSMGMKTLNFDVHCPMLMNKEKIKAVFTHMNQPPYGYCLKSIYANFFDCAGTKIEDLKINEYLSAPLLFDTVFGRPWFSCGDKGLTTTMVGLFKNLYPSPSKYEK